MTIQITNNKSKTNKVMKTIVNFIFSDSKELKKLKSLNFQLQKNLEILSDKNKLGYWSTEASKKYNPEIWVKQTN